MAIEKIISGGQTGADQGGLEAGKKLGLLTGGTAPFGCRTEKGSQTALLRDTYNLVPNLSRDYPPRTKQNVLDSDGTVLFGDAGSPGSRLTLRLCQQYKKPCLIVPMEALNEELRSKSLIETFRTELGSHLISEERAERWGASNSLPDFIRHNNITVLNVAGNRESKNPGIQERVRNFLIDALKEEK